MPPEGMVHALELAGDLLKRRGRLIDIHPSGAPPPVELLRSGSRILLGYLGETDNFIEYAQADAALAQIVAGGWYRLEGNILFDFHTYAQSVAELWQYLSEKWSDVILPNEAAAQAIEAQSGQGLIMASEEVRISVLEVNRVDKVHK